MKTIIENLKIKYKVFLTFFILILFLILVLIFSIYNLEKEAVLTEVEDRITGLSDILAYSSVKVILSNDTVELQGLVESIKGKEDVLEVSIFDIDGKILSSTNTSSIGIFISKNILEKIMTENGDYKQNSFTLNYESYLESISPIYSIEKILGYSLIRVSLERVHDELKKTRSIIILIGTIAILTALFASFYLSKKITNPVIELSNLVREYGKRNFSVQATIKSKDEIGMLSSEFNQMAENIVILEKRLIHEERLSALGKTASAIAHELKTPLTALQAYAGKLPQKLDNKVFLNSFRDIILSEVTRLNNLVNDLLEFSRKENLAIRTNKISDIIHQAVSILSDKTEKNNITINSGEINDFDIECDSEKILQVFLNIIDNAIEASGKGSNILINSQLENEHSNKIAVNIIDSGKGIPPGNLDKLFEPFFSTKSKGTGLGLAICDKIIKMHNGVIKVESSENEGSKFSIILPLKHEV